MAATRRSILHEVHLDVVQGDITSLALPPFKYTDLYRSSLRRPQRYAWFMENRWTDQWRSLMRQTNYGIPVCG
jgi:hypothetical protein